MQLESKKLLQDVLNALELLVVFSKGKSFSDYSADPMLRAAVEREFEIIGEALRRLADRDPETARQIPELRKIVAFRNVLSHGYRDLEHQVVWDALTTKVAPLDGTVRSLLASS
jgi:uncharacterized protein with HEPN domain